MVRVAVLMIYEGAGEGGGGPSITLPSPSTGPHRPARTPSSRAGHWPGWQAQPWAR